jgi:hypothetical protein
MYLSSPSKLPTFHVQHLAFLFLPFPFTLFRYHRCDYLATWQRIVRGGLLVFRDLRRTAYTCTAFGRICSHEGGGDMEISMSRWIQNDGLEK